MLLLSAKPAVDRIELATRSRAEIFLKEKARKPKLVVILIGEDPASLVYVGKKELTIKQWGMTGETVRFASTVSPSEVYTEIQRLNLDPTVDGILIQRPLPKSFKEEELVFWIDPLKDVDAFHPEQVGRLSVGLPCFRPCTPAGIMELLNHYQIPIQGKTATIVGRSSIVGKPMGQLLLQANATVIHCHSHTRELKHFCREADLLIVAAGKPRLINADFVKPGAVVIDVGIHRLDSGKLTGDVDFDSVSRVASALTPVPGGVGPMTISTLLQNTLDSAIRRG